MFSTSLLLLLAAASYVHGEELTQPASMTVQPGQSLSINCKVSYSVTGYYTAWIRQPAGKALEWIGRIYSSGGTDYSDKLKNKFSISRDTSTNTITIRGQNMQTEDTAVYYCAREPTMCICVLRPLCQCCFYHYVLNTAYEDTQAYALIKRLLIQTDVHGVELTQPASMTVQPGQSLSINCKVSYSITSYYTHWIRQPAGKPLEWIGRIRSDGDTIFSDKLKNNFSISRDTSTNMLTIQGQNMQAEDTAVYYCARHSQ
ncbi:hypothetical protein C0J45_13021 [Silurus meridionalis]|nr:hypothetical protein C0J45_13021 [Silurus meridionalis]